MEGVGAPGTLQSGNSDETDRQAGRCTVDKAVRSKEDKKKFFCKLPIFNSCATLSYVKCSLYDDLLFRLPYI